MIKLKKTKKTAKQDAPYTLKTFLIDLVQVFASALLLTLVLLIFVRPCIVSGNSMLPTYQSKDFLILWKLGDIKRNDIIAFNSHNPLEELYIKRVIAVEGDHLVIKDSQVYVNDELIDEPYINETSFLVDIDITIEAGHLFVMGDNRNHSTDSRVMGQIDVDDVMGKVLINFNQIIRNIFK